MGKIYDKDGKKMGIAEICEEIKSIVTQEQAANLGASISKHRSVMEDKSSNVIIAHAVLDTYKSIESQTEQGARLRKLLDNIMTKYQKSTATPPLDDMQHYKNLESFFITP